MTKRLIILIMIGFSSLFATLNAAEQSLQEFRQYVESLRQQERALTKQRDAVHKERKAAENKLVVWKHGSPWPHEYQ